MKRAVVLGSVLAFVLACGDLVLRKASAADVVDIHESYDREGKQLFVHLERRGGQFTYKSSVDEKGGPTKSGEVSAAIVDRFLRDVSKGKRGAKEENPGSRWEHRRIWVTIRPRGGSPPIELVGTNFTWRTEGYFIDTEKDVTLDESYEALVTSIERPVLL